VFYYKPPLVLLWSIGVAKLQATALENRGREALGCLAGGA